MGEGRGEMLRVNARAGVLGVCWKRFRFRGFGRVVGGAGVFLASI